MTATETGTGNAVADFARRVNGELLGTDSLMGHLEHRVIALEAIVAAPWPLRLVAVWRLGRAIRRSVRHFPVTRSPSGVSRPSRTTGSAGEQASQT
jgi:hypothetical protein